MAAMVDVLEMMKKQGINIDGFEAEAEDIWSSLNSMSEKDPEEYRKFIQSQYEESKTDINASRQSSGHSKQPATQKSDEDRFFRPVAGFSISTKTCGGDGIKIRGEGEGKQLFINFCSHPAIEAPLDSNGRPAEMRDFYRIRSAEGLQIPMIIGQLRDVDSTTLAVDALFSKVVIDCCTESGKHDGEVFKRQVVKLAFEWITQDTAVVFSKSWTLCADKYSGGRGNDKLTPALFPVSHATAQSDRRNSEASKENKQQSCKPNFLSGGAAPSSEAGKAEGVIRSPSSLLSALRDSSVAHEDRAAAHITDVNTATTNKCSEIRSSAKKDEKPLLKKGFLNSEKNALYPMGSGEGSGGDRGGSFARVMDKCKVIDIADVAPQPSKTSNTNTSSSSHSKGNSNSDSGSNIGDVTVEDPHVKTSLLGGNSELLKLSQMLVGESSHIPLAASSSSSFFPNRRIHTLSSDVSEAESEAVSGQETLKVCNELGGSTHCTYKSLLVAGRLSLLVELTGIDGSLFDLSSLDLKVSADELHVRLTAVASTFPASFHTNSLNDLSTPSFPSLLKNFKMSGFRINLKKDSAVAKLSKKKKCLTITIEYL